MQTETTNNTTFRSPLTVQIPTKEFRNVAIPGMQNAMKGTCYIRVTDLPDTLDKFMQINPRVPSRTLKGALTGPVVKGIINTLYTRPEEMSIKNQGIYLLVKKVEFIRGAHGSVKITLQDSSRHGIVNGGHTYAAIREAIANANEEQLEQLKNAYVQLHIFQGIEKNMVPDIAEGLNRSRQVDDLSLMNLQGGFDMIQKVLKNTKAENNVAYFQGDKGNVYVAELLVYLELLNKERFDEHRSPHVLYSKQSLGLKYFKEDLDQSRHVVKALMQKLPDILWLSDMIRKMTPIAAKKNKFKFGMAKVGNTRAGSADNRGIPLNFIEDTVDYRVPNGWVYPMLSAFRANLKWSVDGKSLEWIVPIDKILPDIVDQLVAVCIAEHKYNGLRPDAVGKKESAYNQCYSKVQLYLAKRSLL